MYPPLRGVILVLLIDISGALAQGKLFVMLRFYFSLVLGRRRGEVEQDSSYDLCFPGSMNFH